MNRPFLQQRASQQTTLTPRLQQSVHLLQLSSIDFAQELEEAVASNPFLELPANDRNASSDDGGPASAEPPTSNDTVAVIEVPPSTDVDRADDRSHGSIFESGPRDDDSEIDAWAAVDLDLKGHLAQEVGGYRLGPRDRAIAHVVIEALDDDGYLRQELSELASQFDVDPAIDASELTTALHLVQQVGPPGIAARSVVECLSLQLDARSRDVHDAADESVVDVARAIVRDHLALLARRDWTALARRTGATLERVQAAVAMVRGLHPRPGLAFGHRTAPAIVPDVLVRRRRGGWLAETNPTVVPRACLNTRYAELFHRSRLDDRQPLAQQLQEARWLLRNVAQRFITIQRVAQAIVDEQHAFFDHGDIAIKPLALRQVADQLELHESTISRATQGKYMATPRGIFEFKHFFSRQLATQTGGAASTVSIRAAIRELIEAEAASKPLSDVELAHLLTKQGLCVARRTVSKYRALMKIPPAELRRP